MLVEGHLEVGFEVCGVVAGQVYDFTIIVLFEKSVECGLGGSFSAAE